MPAPVAINKRLFEAAQRGDIGGLRAALAEGADFIGAALVIACHDGQAGAAAYLLDVGGFTTPADVEEHAESDLSKALGRAVRNGHEEVVRLFLERKFFDEKDMARHFAPAVGGCGRAVFDALLAETSADSVARWAGLCEAFRLGNREVIQAWREKGLDASRCAKEVFKAAAQNGDPELLELAFDLDIPRTSEHLGPALVSAITANKPAMVERLLAEGARPDDAREERSLFTHGQHARANAFIDEGRSALALAMDLNRAPIVRLLLEHGADPAKVPTRTFTQMVYYGRIEIVEMICEKGGRPLPECLPDLLRSAARAGSPERIRSLLKWGAKPTAETLSIAKACLILYRERGGPRRVIDSFEEAIRLLSEAMKPGTE